VAEQLKRVRRRRPPTLVERAGGFLLNPRLRRRERIERIAIAVAILLMAIYLVARPLVSRYFNGAPSAPASGAPIKRSPEKSGEK
jgi:hypothetical protein